jgi:hypothetical protein
MRLFRLGSYAYAPFEARCFGFFKHTVDSLQPSDERVLQTKSNINQLSKVEFFTLARKQDAEFAAKILGARIRANKVVQKTYAQSKQPF